MSHLFLPLVCSCFVLLFLCNTEMNGGFLLGQGSAPSLSAHLPGLSHLPPFQHTGSGQSLKVNKVCLACSLCAKVPASTHRASPALGAPYTHPRTLLDSLWHWDSLHTCTIDDATVFLSCLASSGCRVQWRAKRRASRISSAPTLPR